MVDICNQSYWTSNAGIMAWDTGAKFPKVGKLHFPSIISIVSKYLTVTWQEQMKTTQAMEAWNLKIKQLIMCQEALRHARVNEAYFLQFNI